MDKNKLEESWLKFITFLDICDGKVEHDLDFDEVISLFMSNFDGDDFIRIRESQK